MQDNNNNSLIINLLVSPRWKLVRYLILLALTGSISAGFVWYTQEQGQLMNVYERYGGFVFLLLFF